MLYEVITKEGDLSFKIKDQLKDEFQELADSFNDMASSLKNQRNKVRDAERLAAVGELAAGLAHEIKNPLAGIKVSIEVLKNDLDLDQEDKEIFLRIINEIHRIESLLRITSYNVCYTKLLRPFLLAGLEVTTAVKNE